MDGGVGFGDRTAGRVLAIDDDAATLELLRRILGRVGYGAVEATGCPTQALETVRRFRPDVVLLDLYMPGRDGFEVLGEILADEIGAGAAVVVLTAETDRGPRLEALRRGARDFIVKPFDAAELVARVDTAYTVQALQRRARDENERLEAEVRARTRRLAEAERAANQAHQRLAAAIEAIPEGVVLWDAEDRLVLCNRRYRELYEVTADLMTPGRKFAEIVRAAAERGQHVLEGKDVETWIADRMARHRSPNPTRYEQRFADGRWIEGDERPMPDGSIVGIRVDVTEARRREARRQHQEKLSALGELAGGVAHEINNLLQPAITLPEFVQQRLPPGDQESREDLDAVLEAARKAREVVRNILLFARQEAPSLTALDLAAETRAAVAFVRGLVPPGVVLRDELGADEMRVAANKTQLTQIVSNLIVNATHAMAGCGAVTLRLAAAAPPEDEAAALGLAPGRRYAALAVADTGHGMDKATLKRIFEPFFTTKPVGQGTGLGLSVVYGILRNWGGAVAVESAPGSGTTFTLYVPLLDASASSRT